MPRRRLILAALLIALAGLLYYFYGGNTVPAGQPPLARLDSGNFTALRDSFNAAKDSVRVIALLSPT